MADESAPTRSITDIEKDLQAARERLSSNVEALVNKVHPKAVASRTVANAKSVANERVSWFKSKLYNEDGTLNLQFVATIAGAVAGVIALFTLLGKLFHRS
ncbi:MAG: DUF3618 domain-containing protein [Propionibacteriaceae bacterium]|jgi:hypothetical protein|nr:DUF3618 domain-containing protein [Propionibacteriaceae bacterium]